MILPIMLIQRFDWQSPNSDCTATFRVTEMLLDIASGKLPYSEVLAAIDDVFVRDNLIPLREPNVPYIRSLTPAQRNVPVLGVRFVSQSVILIDGTHRYCAKFLRHEPTIIYRIVTIADALPYTTITGDITCQ